MEADHFAIEESLVTKTRRQTDSRVYKSKGIIYTIQSVKVIHNALL